MFFFIKLYKRNFNLIGLLILMLFMYVFDLNMIGKMFNYGINKKKNVLFFMKLIFFFIFDFGISRLED